jgi:CO/xanthine dehydrogenase FAD-binding subunit
VKADAEAEVPPDKRTLTDEDNASLDANTLAAEAGRCMNCGCYSVNASDLTPVLIALDAAVRTTKKEVKASDLFGTGLRTSDKLEKGEMIKEVIIPKLPGYVTRYEKFRLRDTLDFAMASIAYAYKLSGNKIEDIRIVLGGVAPVPLKLKCVEDFLKGKTPSEKVAEEASELAVKGAAGIGHNDYKVQEIRTFVRRMVLSMK